MTESSAWSGSSGEARAGQEAAKLLAAAQAWLRTSAPHLAPVDADGTTCVCPLCRAVAGVRDADPDAVGRWVDAAVAAATSTLAQAGERLAPPTDDPAAAPGDDPADDPADDAGYAADDPLDHPSDDPEGGVGVPVEADAEDPVAPRAEPAARQDGEGTRGVRRIPLEQTDPGDLDG